MPTAASFEGKGMKTYIFEVELHREEDGRWSAWIEALPGCAAWGYDREEALTAIKDAAEAYVEDMLDAGEELPQEGVRVVEAPVITITL
jgi:predicted RNase H-like HicB family nuclease